MTKIPLETFETLRTQQQNKSLHKYFELVARELQNGGHTMQDVIEKFPAIEITPTTHAVKEVIWKPIMEATLGRKSTTALTTAEVNQVYEVISMFLSKTFQISLPFPSVDTLLDNQRGNELY